MLIPSIHTQMYEAPGPEDCRSYANVTVSKTAWTKKLFVIGTLPETEQAFLAASSL
jgi:hypothetical protein